MWVVTQTALGEPVGTQNPRRVAFPILTDVT